ncbi:MAG: hypothetical protein U5K69_22345 [Balneolaceae bacterium]|nr:hypothetical protein [Balneolaceae bacterium]
MKQLKALILLAAIFPLLGLMSADKNDLITQEKVSIYINSGFENEEMRFTAKCSNDEGLSISSKNGLTPTKLGMTTESFECVIKPLHEGSLLEVEVIREGPNVKKTSSKAMKLIKKGNKIVLSGIDKKE